MKVDFTKKCYRISIIRVEMTSVSYTLVKRLKAWVKVEGRSG